MSRKFFYLLFTLLTSAILSIKGVSAPQVKYWVFFNNKTGTPYSINNPSQFLSQKAINRRTKYGIPYHSSDLPVNPSYVSLIGAVSGVKVLYASKWLNGVVISMDGDIATAALASINTFSFVGSNVKVNRYKVNVPEPLQHEINFYERSAASSATLCGYDFGIFTAQTKQLNVDCVHEQGYRGQGMTIAVMDVGFSGGDVSSVFDSLRKEGRILGTYDFVDGVPNAYLGGSHGFNVLSCMASLRNGVAIGSAPKANYWLFRTEQGSSETISEEYNWVRAAEYADSVGADILTTSLGYTEFDSPAQNHTYATLNGRTAPMSIAANMAARKGLFVLNAAGNEGSSAWHYISVPGDADSICTVGAVNLSGNYASFSSVGPTADGRIKPDLVACGEGASICDASGNCYGGANGTSFATPILAGAVACYWQAHPNDNNIKVLNDLKKLASNYNTPNNTIGWGIPKLPCTFPPKPTCSVTAQFKHMVGNDGLVKFTSTSTGTNANSQYTWLFGDGNTRISGPEISYVYGKTGVYTASLLVAANNCYLADCSDYSEAQTINIKLEFDFTPYLDPNTSLLKLTLSKITYEKLNIEVYDLLGRVLFSSNSTNSDTTINLNTEIVSSGTYIIQVKTSRGTKIKKIIKL